MRRAYFSFIYSIHVVVFVLTLFGKAAVQDDIETAYCILEGKIQSEEATPKYPNNKNTDAYLDCMQIKVADMDNACALSLRANCEGNRYGEQQFLYLSLDAQLSGEVTVWQGTIFLMRTEDKFGDIGYVQACNTAGPRVGQRLYYGAI